MKEKFGLSFLFSLIVISLSAQYFNIGPERALIKWRFIRTMNFEVIYPEGFDKEGELVAKLLEKSYDFATISLNNKPKKISVILHTGTVKSNAFLGWAPSRIEMYTTPNQGIYSQDWLEQLAIHEYRHMVQLSKLESEMPQILKYLFGEQAAAILTAIYLPFWFIEGDAVATETGLSSSGRGRVPDFQREIRAQLVENGKYSYDKAYLGSYKDNVADHYKMGYLLVSGAREKFHKVIWDSVLNNVAKKPLSLNAFDRGIRKSIGVSKIGLYNSIFDDLTRTWKLEDSLIIPTENIQISLNNYSYTDYKFSSKLSTGNYFSVKSSLSDIDRFVSIGADGKEKCLFTPGYYFEESVSSRDYLVVWSERLPDIRWDHSDLSLIRVLDTENSKLLEHKYDSKVFAPQVSPDLKKILVVEADDKYQFFLTVFDLKTGDKINRYHSPKNDYFITPSWGEKSDEVITVVLRDNKKGIMRVNLKTGEETVIFGFDVQEIRKPKEYKGRVYFIGGYRGIDNLFAVDTASGEIFEVISSRFGISDFSFDGNNIIYNDYTADGFRLVSTKLDTSQFLPVKKDEILKKSPIAENLAIQEKGTVDFKNLDDIHYRSEKYIKSDHLFKFHSWAPLSIDPYNYMVYPGISLMSQNMLSTAETVLGYRYKREEGKGEFYAQYKYLGWYPILVFNGDYGKARSSFLETTQYLDKMGKIIKTETIEKNFSWKETNFSVQTYLPFNFSKGCYSRGLYPRMSYRYAFYQKDNNAPAFFPNGSAHNLETGLYFYTALHSSHQSIIPKFGTYWDIYYNFSLPGELKTGDFFSVSNKTYLPGIFLNHGIKIYNGFQIKEQGGLNFSDRVRFPRGYSKIGYDQIYSYSFDYGFPLCYPDFNIGRWVYFKRIILSLFYDQAFLKSRVEDKILKNNFRSTGFELTASTHFLRFIAPIEIGFRSSYLFNKKFNFDFLFNIQFSI